MEGFPGAEPRRPAAVDGRAWPREALQSENVTMLMAEMDGSVETLRQVN